MNHKVLKFLFVCLLGAQVCLSARPDEINFPLLYHVTTLAIFLFAGLIITFTQKSHPPWDNLTLVTGLFLVYFFTIGILISVSSGLGLVETIKFPYRSSNLLMVLFLPLLVRKEEDLYWLFLALLWMMGCQLAWDLYMAATRQREALLDVLTGSEFASNMFLGTIPFAFAGLLIFWNVRRRRLLYLGLLLVLWTMLTLKLFLIYSRTVWLVILPFDLMAVYFLLRKKFQLSKFFYKIKVVGRIIILLALMTIGAMTILVAYTPHVGNIIVKRFYFERGVEARLSEYKTALNTWLESPISGVGFGHKVRLFKGTHTREQNFIHNFVMQFLMSSGMVGLSLLLAMLGVTTFQIMKLFKRSRTLLQTVILIAIVITLANIVLMSLTETVINAQEVYFLEAIVISFAISIKRLQRQDLLETIRMSKKNYTFGVKGVGNDTSFLGPRIMSK